MPELDVESRPLRVESAAVEASLHATRRATAARTAPGGRRAPGGRLAIAWALAGLALATASPAPAQLYHVRQYTVDEGLPSAHVRDVTQDAEGRIWFATRSGVAAYDGLEWTTYNVADGLTWADQFALAWDAEGVLWSVGAISPFKTFYLEGDRWHELPGPPGVGPELMITSFAVLGGGRDRTLAIGTDRGGVLLGRGGRWRVLAEAEGLPSAEVRALVALEDRLIAATAGGLAAIRGREVDLAPFGVLQAELEDVRSLALEAPLGDAEARLWVVGDDWIGRIEAGRFSLLASRLAPGLASLPATAAADRRGGLYLGGPNAFYHFHPQDGFERIGRDNGILADGVTDLFSDREDNLWVGTARGASKLISRRFARYARAQGLYGDEVTAVSERANGDVVLGHRGGISILRGSEIRTLALAGLAAAGPSAAGERPERVSDMAEDRRGNLWLAAGTLGLARLDTSGDVRWYAAPEGLEGSVTSVLASARGRLWAATEDGLYRLDGRSFLRADGGAPRIRVRRIFEAGDGALLLAAASGLHRFSDDGWRAWSCTEDACNSVFSVLEEPDGGLLVGTAAGLYRTADKALVPEPTLGLGLDRPIYFMVRDTRQRIWFGTDNGVLRWDGEQLDHFTVEDGLAGRETNRAAGMVDAAGGVWIGTERGVTVYTELRPGPPRGPPIVSLTGVDVSGRFLPVVVPQRLGHDDDDLIFHFRAVSLLDENRILISSRLEGFEPDWLAPYRSPNRQIRYTNLPPGDYVLHLKAANAEGTWSAPVSSATLTLARPFWQRTWFYLLIAAGLSASLYGVSSHFSQRKYSRRLEAEVAERVVQLSTEKERLALTLRNIGDGVITTDAEGRIVLLNRTAEAITGWSSPEAVGDRLERVLRLHEPRPAGVVGKRLRLPGPDEPHLFEEMHTADLVTRRGERRLVEISGSPLQHTGGRYTGLVLAFRDVTEKRKLESELARGQKLEALGLLAGGIAHDFNNLLTVLLGNLSLLDQGGLSESRRVKHMQDAETAVLRARDLTQQLLTFSRGGAPVRKAASISEVIHDSASFVMSGSNVRCEIDLPEDLWVVEIDAGQISQVVNNLLINAIQAMPEGGTVRVVGRNTRQTPPSLAGDRYIAIDVIDHGIGILDSHLSRVFDPYFSTKQEGRGLGLASAYSIAKKHDGLLTVESQPGKGTVFSLFLPASEAELAEPLADPAQKLPGGGRILIMDDEDAVRHVTGSIVEQLGYRVTHVADGDQALERYRQAMASGEPYDAVLMDLTIPGGMGGREAIARLLDIDPAARAVVMSGYSNDPVLASHREYGFRGVMSKPFKAEDLARVLYEVLSGETPDGGAMSARPTSDSTP